jgi:hypothetical protein
MGPCAFEPDGAFNRGLLPTGRLSNGLYDQRRATTLVVVSATRIFKPSLNIPHRLGPSGRNRAGAPNVRANT